MKRVLSLVLSLVMALSIITGMDVSVFASTSTTQLSISDSKKEGVVGSSISVSASYRSDTYSHNSETISIKISGKSGGLTVDGGVSCLGTKEDGIISYSLKAKEVGKYTVTISGPDNSSDSVDVYVTESNGYFTVAGRMEDYVTTVVINGSGEHWISEILVDGVYYPVKSDLLDSSRAERAKGKDVVFSVYNCRVDSFYIINDLNPGITAQTDSLDLYYENGRFPDKKIDLTGLVIESLSMNSHINSDILSKYSKFTLTDINVTLTSQNTDIIYFKTGTFSGKKSSVTFSLGSNLNMGEYLNFSQVARVNTGYDFPEGVKEDTVKITCEINGKSDGYLVSGTTELLVKLTNNDYNHKSTWEKQSLTSLMEQMYSSVQVCPNSVLSSSEKMEVSSTINAIIINEQMSKLSDDLDAFDTIYDMGCYFYGIKNATVATAGEMFLNAIIDECNKAEDKLKTELSNLLESLTQSRAFNKFVYWYYNNQQVRLGNKKQVNAHCPIDVSVTDEDGVEVLSIVNDVVVSEAEGASGLVCDSQKTIYLPTDIDHKIKITATADGTMDYSIIEYSSAGKDRTVSYSDIKLTNGEVYSGSVTRAELPASESYNLSTGSGSQIESNEAKYTYTVKDGAVTITGLADGYEPQRLVIPSKIQGYPVTNIGYEAFRACTSLTSVTIPDSVITISSYAFYNCTSLTSVTIPDSVISIDNNAFCSCTSLVSVYIPSSVTNIGSSVFYNCTSLTAINTSMDNPYYSSVNGVLFNKEKTTLFYHPSGKTNTSYVIPDTVTTIESNAFRNCTRLSSITIPNGVTSIGSSAFYNSGYYNKSSNWVNKVLYLGNHIIDAKNSLSGSYTIKSGTKCIADSAFYDCTNLTSVVIAESVTSIGISAFHDCCNLTSLEIPDNVISIGVSAFTSCTKLTALKLGNSVKSIGNNAFSFCTNLTSLTIGNSVTSIGHYAFQYCTGLTSITIPESVTTIGSSAFKNCTGLTSINIPDSVTSISNGAFSGCTKLTTVTLGESVTAIGSSSFYNCTGLTSINIPDSVTSISYRAFSGCTKLTTVTLGESVTSIGYYAFENCTSIEKIYWNAKDVRDYPEYSSVFYSEETTGTEFEVVFGNTVEKIPAYAFGNCVGLKSVAFSNSVISIGHYAFENCTGLVSITIPDSVTSISNGAFRGCTKLTTVTLGESVTSMGSFAFSICTGIEKIYWNAKDVENYPGYSSVFSSVDTTGTEFEVVFGNKVEKIPSYAFENCVGLKSVTISESVTSIGERAFSDCTSLEKIYWNAKDASTYIGYSSVFYGAGTEELGIKVVFGDTVEKIPAHAFENCNKLKSVVVSDSVKNIGDSAFYECYNLADVYITDLAAWLNVDFDNRYSNPFCYAENLYVNGVLTTDIVIPEGITSIKPYTFHGYDYFTSITIPKSMTSIGDYEFYACTSLITIKLPDTLVSIGNYAFYDCYRLSSIEIPDSVTHIGDWAFFGCSGLKSLPDLGGVTHIGYGTFQRCSGFSDLVIPDGITSIDDYAFSGSYGITSVTIPESVTSIGVGAFAECFFLSSITLPDSEINMDSYVFAFSLILKSVTIPESMTSIKYGTFAGCESLKEVYFPNSLVSIEERAFYGCDSLQSIFYDGTEKEWAQVTISEENEDLLNAKVHFNATGHTLVDGACQVCDIKTWEYEIIDDSVAITSYNGNQKNVVVPDTIDGLPVTEIADMAFSFNNVLETVVIGNNVTKIGEAAFGYCCSMKTIIIPDSVTEIVDMAFVETGLQTVKIGKGVTEIGVAAFANCDNLKSITIPANVVEIGEYAFGYNNLEYDDPAKIDDFVIYGEYETEAECYADENGFTFIAKPVCEHIDSEWIVGSKATCTENGLKYKKCTVCQETIEISVLLHSGHSCEWTYDTQNSIKKGVCSVCEKEVVEAITSVDITTFTLNSAGTSYTITDCLSGFSGKFIIPKTYNGLPVTAIGTDAFRDCTEITSVKIPDSVTSIGGSAFRNCTNLTEIEFSQNIKTIPGAMCFGCTSLEKITLPDGVTGIGGYAFSGCSKLKTAIIPDSVTNIGGSVFANCKALIINSNENSEARNYAIDNGISYIANTYGTSIDFDTGFITTEITGGNMDDIMTDSENITYTTDKTCFGTGAAVSVMKDGVLHSQFTLIVNGDTNGDSVCDVLDCAQVELTSNGNGYLYGPYAMAADSNSDEEVDITDYQAIVNRALAS